MTARPVGSDSSQEPCDVADAGQCAATGLGTAIIAQVDLDAITALLRNLPTPALLEQLDAVVAALDSTDPARARRRVGWLGRLLGRDLVALARVEPVEQRVRVALSFAQSWADELASQLVDLQVAADDLKHELARLTAAIGDARGAGPTDDRLLRRLAHLDLMAASWSATLAHVAMVRDHARRLMDRHSQVRDVLVPLWRQHSAASAAGEQLRLDGQPDRFARLQSELRTGLASLHESSAVASPHHPESTAEAPKEPLP
ncbi:MAG TPA: hypothetical protein VIT90_11350 [Lysobacter sp.]